MLKKGGKIIGGILLAYILYVLITAVFIFMKDYELTDEANFNAVDTSEYYRENTGPDRAAIIEEGEFALTTRLNLIENAEKSIKFTNYSIYPGEVTDVIFGLLLEVASQGVEVQFLTDGLSHNLYGPTNDLYWALVMQENVEIRLYESINLLQPWALNNRLHDKMIIVDDEIALTSGRNIGDNHFFRDADGVYGYDRDVLIYSDTPELEGSVLNEFSSYFDDLWNSEFTDKTGSSSWAYFENIGEEGATRLANHLEKAREDTDYHFNEEINWEELSHPTNNIRLITNPIERMKKEPEVLRNVRALMHDAEETIIAQAPYLVYNSELQSLLNLEEVEAELHFLTNSMSSSPNYPAVAGFLNYKDEIVKDATQVYGFQGDGLLHGKSYVFDNRLSLVGSFNLDPRSAFLSTENMVIIDSVTFAEELSANIIELLEISKVHADDGNILSSSVESADAVAWYQDLFYIILRGILYPFGNLL